MRKRIVIAAIAAVVIGLGVYVVWEPGRGTVAYHKKRYVEAYYGRPLAEAAREFWAHLTRRPMNEVSRNARRFKRMEEQAAVGFEEQSFKAATQGSWFWGELQNSWWKGRPRSTADVFVPVAGKLTFVAKDGRGLAIVSNCTNAVAVLAPAEEMPRWEEWIRKANVEAERRDSR
jgi:hypothetical protein